VDDSRRCHTLSASELFEGQPIEVERFLPEPHLTGPWTAEGRIASKDQSVNGLSGNPWKHLFTAVVLAIVVMLWCSAVAARGASTSGGKAGSTAAMARKGSRERHDREVAGVRGFGGFHGFGSAWFDEQSFLIVDATPAAAQVFLDGRLLGSAADLLARALPLAPGRHTAQIIAPGFTPYIARFAADPGFSTRVRVALSHE